MESCVHEAPMVKPKVKPRTTGDWVHMLNIPSSAELTNSKSISSPRRYKLYRTLSISVGWQMDHHRSNVRAMTWILLYEGVLQPRPQVGARSRPIGRLKDKLRRKPPVATPW